MNLNVPNLTSLWILYGLSQVTVSLLTLLIFATALVFLRTKPLALSGHSFTLLLYAYTILSLAMAVLR